MHWKKYFTDKFAPGDDFIEIFFNIVIEFGRKAMSEENLTKLFELSFQQYIMKIFDEKYIPSSPSEYLNSRVFDFGFENINWLLKYSTSSNGIELTNKNHLSQLEKFEQVSKFWLCIANDYYSFKKELYDEKINDKYKRNYVYIKMRSENLTLEKTFELIESEIKDYENQAKKLQISIIDWKNPALTKYVKFFISFVEGAIYFMTFSTRYL